MSFQKIVSAFFKEDPVVKQLKNTNLLTNSLNNSFLQPSLKAYEQWLPKGGEESMIKNLLKALEEKGNIMKKLKIMSFWIQMFKLTKYDLSDIILNKKLKIFTKNSMLKQNILHHESVDKSVHSVSFSEQQAITQKHVHNNLNAGNLEQFLLTKVLIPMYNYFMKLSLNQQLFKLCVIGKVPEDDIFRRGSKIKFIWIFKLYNLINPLIPIVSNCGAILEKFPELDGLRDIAYQSYQDILIMNDFVIEAIEEGAEDNFFLMPYFEMLQFYQTLQEQANVQKKIAKLYQSLSTQILIEETEKDKSSKKKDNKMQGKKGRKIQACKKPRVLYLDQQVREQIQTQTLRVKLISNSIKNPKKDHTRLETEYNERLDQRNSRTLKTMPDQHSHSYSGNNEKNFMEKYRNLD